MRPSLRTTLPACALALAAFGAAPLAHGAGSAGLTGAVAVVTAAPACGPANGTSFTDVSQVFVKAGPSVSGGSNLPNGSYYVRVTDPSGNLLSGTGTMGVFGGQVTSVNGQATSATCVSLTGVVGAVTPTSNGGGVYKVWASTQNDFPQNATKTDTFRIAQVAANPLGSISVYKFYDANANGNGDASEGLLAGWQMQVDDLAKVLTDGASPTNSKYTGVDLSAHVVAEYEPIGNSVLNPYAWIATNAYDASQPFAFTGPSGTAGVLNSIVVDMSTGPADRTVVFGNVCIGPAVGGRTLGYWSNKNGKADMTSIGMANALNGLATLNLVDYKGKPVGHFSGNYTTFRNWALNGNAVNMAYMLSVQVAALKLSVMTGKLSESTMVYAPGSDMSQWANPAGFISIGTLISTAANQLSAYPVTRAGISTRVQQEALKTAIDNINNNRASVAQPDGSRCPALAFN